MSKEFHDALARVDKLELPPIARFSLNGVLITQRWAKAGCMDLLAMTFDDVIDDFLESGVLDDLPTMPR